METTVSQDQKAQRKKWQAAGLCGRCGSAPEPGYKVCARHRSKSAAMVDLSGLNLAARQVFTTGQAAAVCRVAPRTAGKWIDAGRLKGYRIPGSNDRRIGRDDLISFMRVSNIPIPPELLPGVVLGFGVDEADVPPGVPRFDAFGFGAALTASRVAVAVVGDTDGMSSAIAAASRVKSISAYTVVLLVCGADVVVAEGGPWARVFRRPFDKSELAAAITALGGSLELKEKV